MAGIRKKKLKCGYYQGWYFNYNKKRIFFKGTTSKTQTLNIAFQKETEHHKLWLKGLTPSKTYTPIYEILDQYFSWGNSHGGKRGNPWSTKTFKDKKYRLNWWIKKLSIKLLGDLEKNTLFNVEKCIQEFKINRTGKTVHLQIEALNSFINWCIKHNFIQKNILKGVTKFDKEPKSERRALTPEEFKRLYEAAPLERKILYEVAVNSGLRAKELKCLSTDDLLDNGLKLNRKWTKNREDDIQPLSKDLIYKLTDFINSGIAKASYKLRFNNKTIPFVSNNPLLYVPAHPERCIKNDAIKAGIPLITNKGKIDFHSLRVTFITLIIESGATLKETQELARHSDINLTAKVYAKIRDERIKKLNESVFSVCSTSKTLKEEFSHPIDNKAVNNKTYINKYTSSNPVTPTLIYYHIFFYFKSFQFQNNSP